MAKIVDINFFVYPVSNIEVSKEFYQNVLELPLGKHCDNHWVEFTLNNQTIALTDDFKDRAVYTTLGSKVALECDNIEDFLKHLSSHNVKIQVPLLETPYCKIAIICDPDGNAIVLNQHICRQNI